MGYPSCGHRGRCHGEWGSFSCQCIPGYTGHQCEEGMPIFYYFCFTLCNKMLFLTVTLKEKKIIHVASKIIYSLLTMSDYSMWNEHIFGHCRTRSLCYHKIALNAKMHTSFPAYHFSCVTWYRLFPPTASRDPEQLYFQCNVLVFKAIVNMAVRKFTVNIPINIVDENPLFCYQVT